MDNEQPAQADSMQAATALMESKLFGPADEPAAEEQQAEVSAETEETEQEEENAVAGDLVEIETDEGEKYQVPQKLKDAFLRRSDYTQKTQQLSSLQQKAEDQLMYAQAREQIVAAVVDDVTQAKALQARIEEFNNVNWAAIYQADPGQAMQLRDQRDQLEKKLAGIQGTIQQKAQHLQQMMLDHSNRQWEIAEKGVIDRIGQVSQEENVAMAKQAQALGFSVQELKGRFADPRILHAIYKAAKWDAVQSGKTQALGTAKAAPPVIKPGSSDPSMSAKMANLNWHKQMKAAKSPQEKQALAMQKMTKFFG